MSPLEHSYEQCPAGILRLLGDYTTLRIVETLVDSRKRFTELLRTLEDTNSVTLTDRLKKLADTGIVVRSKATIDQKSVTYGLTSVGLQLTPVLDAIKKFAALVRSAEDSPENTLH